MFNTYLSIEERMDRESWSEDDELIESAVRQLRSTESEERPEPLSWREGPIGFVTARLDFV